MTQGKIEFGSLIEGENRIILLSALNITESDLLERCPIQIVSTGHSSVMIGIQNRTILNQLKPNFEALSKLSERIKCNGFYIFTSDSAEDHILINGRMFAPVIGINEDPVTGNANGPLGAYLIHHKLVDHNGALFKYNAKQGEAIGRPGIIEVEVRIENEEPAEVKISGKAVILFHAELVI